MTAPRRDAIMEALRQRVRRGLASGALRAGDRLPSTRELAVDLDADPRVVAAAYQRLAEEGLVELRPRSGVFVGALPAGRADETSGDPSAAWLAEVVAAGVRRSVPAPRLAEVLRRATASRTIRAAVVAITQDQAVGLARELQEAFGLEVRSVLLDELPRGGPLPAPLRRAQLLVGTELTAARVRQLAAQLGRAEVVIDVRPDLVSPAWRLLLRQVTYVVIADPRFGMLVRELLAGVDGAQNLTVLVAGRDDLDVIPPEAPTYVTEAARRQLGRSRLPGRLVAPVRTLADATVQAVAEVVVRLNLEAGRKGAGA